MNPLLSSELLKLRTTRGLYIAVGLVLAFAAALPFIGASIADSAQADDLTASSLLDIVRGPVELAGGAVLLLGLLASAGEFRHRTVMVSRLAEPRPLRLLAAKMTAVALVGVAVGLALDVLSLASGSIVLQQRDLPVNLTSYGVPRALAIVPVMLALYGVLGVAVGAIVRSTAGAVGAVMGWAFVVEGVLPVVTGSPDLADRLPSAAFKALLHSSTELTPWVAAGLLAVYGAALVAAAALVEQRREL